MKLKKHFFLIIFLLVYSTGNAQLKVQSNGKVGIGTTNSLYGSLEIGKLGSTSGLSIYDSSTNKLPFKLYSDGDFGYLNFGSVSKGITIKNNGRIGLGFVSGMAINSFLNIYITPSNASSAFSTYADFGFDFGDVVKVYSGRHTDFAYVVRDRSANDNLTFYVSGDGNVYSKGSLLTASDEAFKNNILSINNGLNIVKQLRGVTYYLNEQSSLISNTRTVQSGIILDSISAQSDVTAEIADKIKLEKQRKKIGFIAQELEKVFPEAVYTLPDGKKAIAYSEIIPLLVEAIKEQQNEIDELRQNVEEQQSEINELKQNKTHQNRSVVKSDNDKYSDASLLYEKIKATLYSNIPNPFKEQTIISYFIPEMASKASIHIYNLQGNQIKQISILEKGKGEITINGYELSPGMYMYSLIVDGKEIDTKKMILTE